MVPSNKSVRKGVGKIKFVGAERQKLVAALSRDSSCLLDEGQKHLTREGFFRVAK
jgi:hypothetical protein